MPGFLLHSGATVICMHTGQARPITFSPRVKVSGQSVVTQTSSYMIAGCPFVPPGGNGPCVTAKWINAATRVRVEGMRVLLRDSQAVCTPTGTGLKIIVTQMRVKGI